MAYQTSSEELLEHSTTKLLAITPRLQQFEAARTEDKDATRANLPGLAMLAFVVLVVVGAVVWAVNSLPAESDSARVPQSLRGNWVGVLTKTQPPNESVRLETNQNGITARQRFFTDDEGSQPVPGGAWNENLRAVRGDGGSATLETTGGVFHIKIFRRGDSVVYEWKTGPADNSNAPVKHGGILHRDS
ncbi:hypothetical protein SMC26_14585 [Actinomadura fulvescens]|uniref:hypothetical protein n=1 Tax=Actinomadura fulvescens TaxID=46160 RepID=UPI0031CECDF3